MRNLQPLEGRLEPEVSYSLILREDSAQAGAQPKIKLDSIWTCTGEMQDLNNGGVLLKNHLPVLRGWGREIKICEGSHRVHRKKGAGMIVSNI